MPNAAIRINGVTGSNLDLPLATLVTLTNLNTGGELSYAWEILDQPAGTADALSAASGASVTFTPNKEGTYLLKLTVNGTLVNQVVAACKQCASQIRIPAAQETNEASSTRGWAVTENEAMQFLDSLAQAPGFIYGIHDPTKGAFTVGDVVRVVNTIVTVKPGLPGETKVPLISTIPTPADLNGIFGVVEAIYAEPPSALKGVGTGAQGLKVRIWGLTMIPTINGAPAAAQSVWLEDGAVNNNRVTTTRAANTGSWCGRIIGGSAGAWMVFWLGMSAVRSAILTPGSTSEVVISDAAGLSALATPGGAGLVLTSDGAGSFGWV